MLKGRKVVHTLTLTDTHRHRREREWEENSRFVDVIRCIDPPTQTVDRRRCSVLEMIRKLGRKKERKIKRKERSEV